MQLYLDYVLMFEFNEFTGVAYSGQYLLKAIADFVVRATNRANDYYTNMLLSGNFENLSDREYSALLKYVNCIMFPDVEITEEMLDGLLIAVSSIDNFDQYDKATQIEIIAYLLKNGTQYIEDLGNSLIPENYKEQIIPLINAEVLKSPPVVISSAVNWIMGIAADPNYGYSQASPRFNDNNVEGKFDYDCSSLVISAFEQAGIENRDSNGNRIATATGNMRDWLTKERGFIEVTNCNLSTGEGLQRGDILYIHNDEKKRHHTAIFLGFTEDGLLEYVDAGSDEFGGITGGALGDQVQENPNAYPDRSEEIGTRKRKNLERFEYVYRYVGV